MHVQFKMLTSNICSFTFVAISRKSRIIDVVYNASNNELVRTKTLVKSTVVQIDATPFRQWYEAHYAAPLGRKKGVKLVSSLLSLKSSEVVSSLQSFPELVCSTTFCMSLDGFAKVYKIAFVSGKGRPPRKVIGFWPSSTKEVDPVVELL